MRLSLPEAGDDAERWLRGLYRDGGYWVDIRRLADHDHSGGLMGNPVGGGFLTQATADALYVNVTGDTMTGGLTVTTLTVRGQDSDARYALQSALTALTTRVSTLESQVATLQSQMAGHTHTSGTIDVMGGPAVMP